MLSLRQTLYLPIFILLITFVSANQWSRIPLGGTAIVWALQLATLISMLWCKMYFFRPDNRKNYRIVFIYMIWMLIGVVRGVFECDEKFLWMQLISGTFALVLPIVVYVYSDPDVLQETLYLWVRVALIAFVCGFILILKRGAYHYFLGPVFLLACFLPILPKKWKFIFLGLLGLMIVADLSARSQVIKAGIVLMVSVAYLLSKYISQGLLKFVHWICYIVPIVLLYLGITGVFNPFQAMDQSAGDVDSEDMLATSDTRTFIYYEVIESALRHDYVWQGRTPAHGNDSEFQAILDPIGARLSNSERHENEICFANIFTWLGLVGVILYSLLYLKSSWLAVFRSNNIWMKLLGIFIAFRWAYGWIEDYSRFDIMSISLWMMIAMGFSERFRSMTDVEMRDWVLQIFIKNYVRSEDSYLNDTGK